MEVSQRRVGGGGSFSRWSSTRRGTLAIAAVSTLVAAGILAFAMDRYRQSVNSTEKPVTVLDQHQGSGPERPPPWATFCRPLSGASDRASGQAHRRSAYLGFALLTFLCLPCCCFPCVGVFCC